MGRNEGRFEDKVVLITGAARGQGRAHARRFAAEGANIIAVDACAPILPDVAYEAATEEDFHIEFLDLVATVRVVADLDEAIDHVNRHSSGLSEAIVTDDVVAAERFLNEVDAAAVLLNASTRFVDGGELGLGAEVGISTQKIHARGPMGLEALTSLRWVIRGEGQTRT